MRQRWRAAGLAELTGAPDGPPLDAPDGVVERIEALGAPIGVDPLPLLAERAALAGLRRGGTTSCGGATRLLEASDSWVALSLARPEDLDLVPAFLGIGDGSWEAIAVAVGERSSAELRSQAVLLGLPFAILGEVSSPPTPVVATKLGDAEPLDRAPLVVDLSSLWAGPLCSRLLLGRGARVRKVESRTRPDGARRGSPAFFERLNGGKEYETVDLADTAGLRAMLLAADVVIEGSRPRALQQLGIDAVEIATSGPRVWLSITGHGRGQGERDRVGFGDDTAVAGGLVARQPGGQPGGAPCFLADAIADPLTGIAAAAAVTEALTGGGRWLVDASLSRVAAWVAQPAAAGASGGSGTG